MENIFTAKERVVAEAEKDSYSELSYSELLKQNFINLFETLEFNER